MFAAIGIEKKISPSPAGIRTYEIQKSLLMALVLLLPDNPVWIILRRAPGHRLKLFDNV